MSTYPSQEHFNEIHREAHSYGEEDERLVVAADYVANPKEPMYNAWCVEMILI